MKKFLLILTFVFSFLGINAESMKMVVDNKGNVVGRYVKTSGKNYVVDVQDTYPISKKGHKVVIFTAEKGQGVVVIPDGAALRKGPSKKSALLERLSSAKDEGCVPVTYQCLGKRNGWYKICVDGKVGYVSIKEASWDGMDTY